MTLLNEMNGVCGLDGSGPVHTAASLIRHYYKPVPGRQPARIALSPRSVHAQFVLRPGGGATWYNRGTMTTILKSKLRPPAERWAVVERATTMLRLDVAVADP